MPVDAPARRTTMLFRSRPPGDSEEGLSPLLRLRPLLWAIVYVVGTTLSFAPTLTFRGAAAAPGSIATRDVVAPRDLIVPDPAATEKRRAEAADEVLPVYDWDTTASARLEKSLTDAFGRAREAAAGAHRRRTASSSARQAFGLPIGEEALAALARVSFSSDLEDRVTSAVADLYRTGVVDNRDLLLKNRLGGVQLRDPSTGREVRRRELSDVVEYGSQAKTALLARLAGSPLKGRELSEVVSFLAAALRPNLTFNAAETARRREEAAKGVETVLTKIPRGKVIVRRGDEITARSAEWIAAARASAADPTSWLRVAGIAILETLAAAAFWLDSRRQRRRMRERSARVVYGSVLASGILFSLVTRGGFALAQGLSSSFDSSPWAAHAYYAIPFAAGSIMVSLVAGMGPALLFAAVHSIGAGVLMGQSFAFVLFAIVGSLAGIFGLGKLRSRSVLLAMGGIVAGANLVSVSAITFLSGEASGSGFAGDAIAGLLGGWFVAMVIGVFLPLFESLFHVATDIRMLELSNQNLPLLRTLALEAPGTYQHSLMVGHLAEAATEAIGADSLLARVAGYYHDIGKTKMSDYFIENQPKGFNRHDRLEPSMSALVIAAHVKEGVEMARKARLPEPLVAAIREHHGTKLIRYFYQKALTRSEAAQGAVSDMEYRHTGPKPATRVNAVLMVADAVEAASRTLIDPTPPKIRSMIQTIVDDCLRDGQFDNCDLTMRDLAVIVDTLERSVATVFHHRIDYPGFEFNRERSRHRNPEGGSEIPVARTAGPRVVS